MNMRPLEPRVAQGATVIEWLFRYAEAATCRKALLSALLWAWFCQAGMRPAFIAWAVLMHASQLFHIGLTRAFVHRRPTGDSQRWERRYRGSVAAQALLWGGAPFVFAKDLQPAELLLLLLVLMSAMQSGLLTMVCDRSTVGIWAGFITVPLVAVLAWQRTWHSMLMAAFLLAYSATCGLNALQRARALAESSALVDQLNHQMRLTQDASRDKSRFLAAASHDLRQPLHALSFFGATLEKRLAQSPHVGLISNMMRSIEALDRSFSAILDVSKLDAQAVEPHVQVFALRDLFLRLQMSFGGQAEDAGLQLRFRVDGRWVKSDPQMLERVLGNLIQNALRYTSAGGVVVAARACGSGTNIEVWDTGIGIEPEEIPKIFHEYYQVANPERNGAAGHGIGLAVVRRLTDLLGHRLTVKSRPGSGSLFRLWIAAPDLEQMEEFTAGSDTLPPLVGAGSTILLIDDDESIRESVTGLLRQWGYSVFSAATAQEARELARGRGDELSLVISDLRLRGEEDGIQAIDEVRRACGSTVPAVLVTGDTEPRQVQRIHDSGHVTLFKPVDPRDLFEVLQRVIE